MKQFKKCLAIFLAAVLALSVLAMPTFAEDAAPSLKDRQIQGINAARAKYGKNTLQEDAVLSKMCDELLNVYISFSRGEISEEEWDSKEDEIRNKAEYSDRKKELNIEKSSTVYIWREGTPENFDFYGLREDNEVVVKEAAYIGNAIREVDGCCYWVLYFAKVKD